MRANLKNLRDHYAKELTGELFEGVTVNIDTNTTKVDEDKGNCGSLTFTVTHGEGESAKTLFTTLYVIEKNNQKVNKTFENVVFVNNHNKSIIFNNYGSDAINKAEAYITKYINRWVMRQKGIEVPPIEKKEAPKKPEVEETSATE